nr:ATP-binding protein [Lachnospiraceae bacterium]
SESKVYNSRIRERICNLAADFTKDNTPEEMKNTLTMFYKDYGVGKFGLHKAFRIIPDPDTDKASIVPILNIAHVRFDDLVGYDIQKAKLIENTDAFVEGRRANNCLLYGDAGTGKSSSIKAVANEYYESGLRIIEIYKHDFRYLNDVISQIKNRNYKFIIYMDDLSFEEFETEYKYLKAVIEGGLEKKPRNVLIYATSNRRHLVRERFSDKEERDEDIHVNDTVQEKLSLSARFGVSIYFGAPDKKEFGDIVKALAARNGITMSEEELLAEANKWELSHGGFSGRTASQFIDHLLSIS